MAILELVEEEELQMIRSFGSLAAIRRQGMPVLGKIPIIGGEADDVSLGNEFELTGKMRWSTIDWEAADRLTVNVSEGRDCCHD